MEVPLKVALAQYASGRDPAEIVAEARAAAAEIVVFPEMYSNGYARFDPDDAVAGARWCAAAENLGGDFVGRFRRAAMEHRLHVVATFLETAEPKPCTIARCISATSTAPNSPADAAPASRHAISKPARVASGWV